MLRRKLLLLLVLTLFSVNFLFLRVAASPAIGSTTTTIYALADAYVNSSSPDTNYGTLDHMYVSADSEQSYIYTMFELSSIPSDANIISATLKLHLSSTGGKIYTSDTIATHYCSDNSWTEPGITWNTKPSFSPEPSDAWSFPIIFYVNQYKSWDITKDVKTALPIGNLTEVLNFGNKKDAGYAVFNSRESSDKPKLEVEYSTKPVLSVHLDSVQDTGATANLGFTTFADHTFSLPTDTDVVNGSYTVTYSGGYTFVRWQTTAGVAVSDENSKSTTVTVSGNGTLRAVGSAEKLEYAYDHGNPQSQSEGTGHIDAVAFTPLFSGQLLTARFYMLDLSSYQSNTFKVHVMDKGRDDIITAFNVTPTSEGWFDVDMTPHNLTVNEGEDFYIGMEWVVNYNPVLGEDRTNASYRSWHWNGVYWDAEEYSDFMIRAVIARWPTANVGVMAGDWFAYGDVSYDWASNWTGHEEPPFDMNMVWIDTEVLTLHDGNVTGRSTAIYKNGTEQTYVQWGDIATGEGNISVGLVPSNLGAGEKIPANLTWYTAEPLELFINGTVTRRYAGANREVNYAHITYPIVYGNITYGAWNMSYYWDKKTGILCEENVGYKMSNTANSTFYYMNMSIINRMTATNTWPAIFTAQDGYSYNVTMESNSTISSFNFEESLKQISFDLTGPSGKMGYCNVMIPKDFLKGEPWTILLNGTDYVAACRITENNTHTLVHIPHTCSTNTVQIIGTWVVPEFPYIMILPLFTIFSIIGVVLAKKIKAKNS